jgi:hypothetical protein
VCDVPCTDDHCLRSPGTRRPEAPRPLHGGLATPGFPYGFAPPLGLASRTDEMLLFFRPCFVASAYVPGPSFPRLVPLKSSSSKNFQVPVRMTMEEMLLPHFPSSFILPKMWV